MGITEKPTVFGNAVRVYDKERTICDLYLLFNLKSDNLDKNKLREAVNTTFAYRNTELDANSILSDLNDI